MSAQRTSDGDGHFPVTYSTIAADALRQEIANRYDLPPVTDNRLWVRGNNDLYVLTTAEDRFAVRVYRLGWRTDSEVAYELDALDFLASRGTPVNSPIHTKDGETMWRASAPEGRRPVAVFPFCEGAVGDTIQHSYDLGKALATIHTDSDGFVARHERAPLDTDHLLRNPLRLVGETCRREDQLAALAGIADKVEARIEKVASELDFGFCHGDVSGRNSIIDPTGVVTLIDFDCCGPGWRVLDLATYRLESVVRSRETAAWDEFLRGYGDVRPIGQADLEAVDVFVAALLIWGVGFHAQRADDLGRRFIDNDEYWDDRLGLMRDEQWPWHSVVS